MDRAVGEVRLRPMGLGDLFDETFRLYRRHWLSFVVAMSLATVPATLVWSAVVLGLGIGASGARPNWIVLATTGVAAVPAMVLLGLGELLAWAVVVRLTNAAIFGEPLAVRDAYRAAFRELIPMIWSAFLVGLFSMLLMVTLLGIPVAIYLGLGWSLFVQTCVLERSRGMAALRRSAALVRGNRWRFLGISVLLSMLLGVLVSVPAGLVTFASGMIAVVLDLKSSGALLIQGVNMVVEAVAQALFGAISPILMTLLYYDLRVRKEAFDLEQRVEVIDSGGVAEQQ